MKWYILGFSVLGIIAATSAGFMMLSLQQPTSTTGQPARALAKRQILTAAHDLPNRHVIRGEDLEVLEVPAASMTGDFLVDPTEAIGRLLVVPLYGGQALTPAVFVRPGSGLHLSSILEDGTRAVSVRLTDGMGIESLLSPGCVVDVIVSIQLESDLRSIDSSLTVTILEKVTVLGVGGNTVVSPISTPGQGGTRAPTDVVLLLEARQAQRLKLAMERGEVSLVLRNPSDDSEGLRGVGQASWLSSLSPALASLSETEHELARISAERERERFALERERDRFAMEQVRRQGHVSGPAGAPRFSSVGDDWEITVIHGTTVERIVFANIDDAKGAEVQ